MKIKIISQVLTEMRPYAQICVGYHWKSLGRLWYWYNRNITFHSRPNRLGAVIKDLPCEPLFHLVDSFVPKFGEEYSAIYR